MDNTKELVVEIINEKISNYNKEGLDVGKISDGYHTFDELYHHRTVLFASICNMFNSLGGLTYKSKLHADGTMYDGMFIAGIHTPNGQYSYHCEMEYWDMFENEELEYAPEWDGHKPKDITRLLSLLE